MQGNHFKKIATGMDIMPLLNALEKKPHLWDVNTERQQYAPNQKDTQSIFLRWCETKTVEAAFTEIPAVDYPCLEELPEARPLIAAIARAANATEIGRVLLTKLRPDGFIEKHIDEGSYAAHYNRFHLAIHSDKGNLFFAEGEEDCGEFCHMDAGEIWWFNNKRPHWLWNDSITPRIHLIVDAITSSFGVPCEIPA